MKKLLKKIFLPIFLSVLCGFLCGRLMFSIYEDKEKDIISSSVIYLLEDTSYDNYNDMKTSFVSNNYIYYEENGKYNTVIAMTKDKNNIDKIEGAYDKKFNVVEYLLDDSEINKKIDEYDKKIENTTDNNDIKLLVEELNGIYKGREDIKIVKIS